MDILPNEILAKIFSYILLNDPTLVSKVLGIQEYHRIITSTLNTYISNHNTRLNPTYYLRTQPYLTEYGNRDCKETIYFGKSSDIGLCVDIVNAFANNQYFMLYSDVYAELLPGFIIYSVFQNVPRAGLLGEIYHFNQVFDSNKYHYTNTIPQPYHTGIKSNCAYFSKDWCKHKKVGIGHVQEPLRLKLMEYCKKYGIKIIN